MGKVHERIEPALRAWIERQHVFFVATAPLEADGHVNLSPKGLAGTFAVLDEHRVAYLDLTGSGIETLAHLRQNGRLTIMFCAFDGPPRIVRLQGRGRAVVPGDDDWPQVSAHFPHRRGTRGVVVLDADRIADSCGYSVPLLAYEGDRDRLDQWAASRCDEELVAYRAEKNAVSIDGLPGIEAPTAG